MLGHEAFWLGTARHGKERRGRERHGFQFQKCIQRVFTSMNELQAILVQRVMERTERAIESNEAIIHLGPEREEPSLEAVEIGCNRIIRIFEALDRDKLPQDRYLQDVSQTPARRTIDVDLRLTIEADEIEDANLVEALRKLANEICRGAFT